MANSIMHVSSDVAHRVTSYCEPILRFSLKRLVNSEDAEDLAQDILVDVISGLQRSNVKNIDAWIWTVAQNCFRRRLRLTGFQTDSTVLNHDDIQDSRFGVEERIAEQEEMKQVFRTLLGISEKYRQVLVEFYLHERTYQEIASILSIPMSSVKWRMHEGRQRFEERWERNMNTREKVVNAIDWVIMNNGSMDPNRYLDRQINRVIAVAAYEKPLSVEEISEATGIPCLFIEDELDGMLFGETFVEVGGKYATNFIIHRLSDSRNMKTRFQPLVRKLSAKLLEAIHDEETAIRNTGFRGNDYPLERLMWILVPRIVRTASGVARKQNPEIATGEYPRRNDGGYGWFNIFEGSYEDYPDSSGQNSYTSSNGQLAYRYYWVLRYFSHEVNSVFHTLEQEQSSDFIHDDESVNPSENEELTARMIACGMARKNENTISLDVPVFTETQDEACASILSDIATGIVPDMNDLLAEVFKSYKAFTPKRLADQIRGNIGGYLHNIIGMIMADFEERRLVISPPSPTMHIEVVKKNRTMAI